MEQLKEILKFKFWILLGVGIILTFTGWWMATGALAATIKTRKDVLSKVEGSIPSSPQTIPNDRWSSELSKLNEQQEALVTTATRELWERQKARMFWPPNVEQFAKEIPYRGEFPTYARNLFRTNYPIEAERVWQLVRPVKKFDGSGIVEFPGTKFPMRRWGELAPTSAEMWDSMEDFWLLEPLLEAIRDLNGDETATRMDAAVYVIDRFELVGGQRGQPISAPTTGQGGMDGSGALMGDAGMLGGGGGAGPMGGRDMMGGGNLAGAKFATVSADFNYKEEFGDGGDPPWQSGGRGGMPMGGTLGSGASVGFAEDDGAAPAAASPTESNYRRYVDDDESLPYRTRGFYLSVIMDHRRVPELIAALTANGKSDWPVEIVRVQVARINSDDSDMGQPGGTMAGGMMPGSSLPPAGAGRFADVDDLQNTGSPMPFAEGSGSAPGFDGGLQGATGFPSEQAPMSDDDLGLPAVPQNNPATFQNVLRDPFVAKVALCGLIYLYKPVEPPPAAETTPPTETPATDATTGEPTAAEGMPAEGAAPAEGAPAPTETPATPDETGAHPAKTEEPTDAPAPTDPAEPKPDPPAR